MKYILIQILLNTILFRFASEKVIRIYKKLAYILYPVLITILMIPQEQEFHLNGNYGFAIDITDLYSKFYLLTLALIILIQFIFNNFLFKVINRRLANPGNESANQ
jgi:hypothetical protein